MKPRFSHLFVPVFLFAATFAPTIHAEELKYLEANAPDAVLLLPPPPVPGSTEDVADREETFRLYSTRTPEQFALGKEETKLTIFNFAPAIGEAFKPGGFPLTEALFKTVEADVKAITNAGKDHWKRLRPFATEPQRFTDTLEREKSFSYPSGHSTRGTVFALVLASLFPAKSEMILAKGREIGWLRVTGGVHTPLDIYAGRVLGQAIARDFLQNPDFQKELAAVRAELTAGGL